MTIEKIKILGAILELHQLNSTTNLAHLAHFLGTWAGLVPRILTFSIVMGAIYSFYVKSIAIFAHQFFEYNNSVLAIVCPSTIMQTMNVTMNRCT